MTLVYQKLRLAGTKSKDHFGESIAKRVEAKISSQFERLAFILSFIQHQIDLPLTIGYNGRNSSNRYIILFVFEYIFARLKIFRENRVNINLKGYFYD